MTTLPTLLAFLDVETTGLDTARDEVVEVAVVLVEPVAPWACVERRSFVIAHPTPLVWHPHARAMHEVSGLLDALAGTEVTNVETADAYLAQWIISCTVGAPHEVWPAGSNVGFDLAMLGRRMPRLTGTLSHRRLDVVERAWSDTLLGCAAPPAEEPEHRAMPDALASWRRWARMADQHAEVMAAAALTMAR